MTSIPDAASRLRKLAKNRRFEELEGALLDAIEEIALDELLSVLRVSGHRADENRVEALIWIAVTSWAESHGPAEGLEVARGSVDLSPMSDMLREEVSGLYRAAYPELPGLETALSRTVLRIGLPLPDGVRRMDGVARHPPGTYVVEPGRKDPGRVAALAEDGDALEIEFGTGSRTLNLDSAAELRTLGDDDFRALAVFEKDRLAALAKDDPQSLAEMLLRVVSPLNYRGLRSNLVDLVPGPWTAWWAEARPKIRRSPWIDMTAGTQPTLELRRVALAEDVRVSREIRAASGVERLILVLEYLEDAGDHAASEAELLGGIVEILLSEIGEASLALGTVAILEEIRRISPEALAGVEVPSPPVTPSPASLVGTLPDARLQRLSLAAVMLHRADDWAEFFARAMPACHQDVCEWAAAELVAAGEGVRCYEVSATVMAHPIRAAGALIWLWRAVGNGELPEKEGGPDREILLTHLLAALDRESRGDEGRGELFSRLRTALSSRNYATVRIVLETLDRVRAKRVQGALLRCLGLPDVMRVKLTDILVDTHAVLFVRDLPPWSDESVIYTTREGVARKQEEYAKLVNDRLPEVAQAIGEAAAEGDLSENAEYTAALETRARLTERANVLKADLDKAKEIPADMPRGDSISVGSRALAKNLESGEERNFTFLGPWDADMDAGIYSYRAPVSQAFMGKKVGQVAAVTTQDGEQRWEILQIRSGLA